jgi:hypothetical protein
MGDFGRSAFMKLYVQELNSQAVNPALPLQQDGSGAPAAIKGGNAGMHPALLPSNPFPKHRVMWVSAWVSLWAPKATLQ